MLGVSDISCFDSKMYCLYVLERVLWVLWTFINLIFFNKKKPFANLLELVIIFNEVANKRETTKYSTRFLLKTLSTFFTITIFILAKAM